MSAVSDRAYLLVSGKGGIQSCLPPPATASATYLAKAWQIVSLFLSARMRKDRKELVQEVEPSEDQRHEREELENLEYRLK